MSRGEGPLSGQFGWGFGRHQALDEAGAVVGPLLVSGLLFGIFNAVYGVAWFAGSVLLGILYDLSIEMGAMWRRERMSVCSGVTGKVSRTA